MVMLNDAILKLVIDGVVDVQEALGKSADKKDLHEKLTVAGLLQPQAKEE
jgi:hypothetical protein